MKTTRHLNAKGLEYRGTILAAMIRAIGEPATVAVMKHDQLRSLINAGAQSAANAPTAQVAAAIATALLVKLVNAIDAEVNA